MAVIGTINDLKQGTHYSEWKIPKFLTLSDEVNKHHCSPSFFFAGEFWNFRIYPNGHKSNDSVGYIGLYLKRNSSGPPISLDFLFSLKTLEGKSECKTDHHYTFDNEKTSFGASKIMLRAELLERHSSLLPNNILTVFSIVKCSKSTENENEPCLACGSSIVVHQNKLQCDYKELFLNKEDCDVVIKIRGQEFPAHKTILTARSRVLASTFRSDMKEKATGVVEIEDCDPSSFTNFLCFLYSGDADTISEDNVFSLFTAADKYDVQDLRAKCLEFVKEKLSVDIYCDALTLALQYSETELIESTADFFIKNAPKIIVTNKWQLFSAENPKQSNDLFIKLLVPDASSSK